MLTPRQREVCERVVLGFSDRQIAADLRISEETVNFHLRKIFEKFRVRSRTEAAVFFVKMK